MGSIHAQYVSDYSPQMGVVFPEGGDAVLTCRSPAPWYICIWEGPGGIACTCQLSGASGTLCNGYQKVTLTGSGNECMATVSGVSYEDAGNTISKQFDKKKRYTAEKFYCVKLHEPLN